MAAPTAKKQRRGPGRPFQKGQSGNPAGRQKGSRNVLEENMLRDLCEAWQEYGAEAITAVLADNPADFLKICASLLPKQIQAEVEVHNFVVAPETATDDEWKAFLAQRNKPPPPPAPVKRTNGSNGTTH